MSDVRTTPCMGSPQIIDARRPFSNFDFIEKTLSFNLNPIHRIFSQARVSDYKTLVIEKIRSVGFSKEDDIELQETGLNFSPRPLIRLSFFNTVFQNSKELSNQNDSNFLGYAVLKQIPSDSNYRWIVFEAVTSPSRYINNYLNGEREYSIKVGSKFFNIKGNLYCQQNSLTNVCAHAALRTCISMIHHSGDFSYRSINKILADSGKPHETKAPLSTEQILTVLDELGFKYSLQIYGSNLDAKDTNSKKEETEKTPFIPYQAFLYGSVESGYPALLGFSLEGGLGHIIPILGHTFNEDTWVPNAERSYFKIGEDTRYIPSESWVSTYICHDDNFGSYYCLPRQYISGNAALVIAIGPSKAEYDGIAAEAIAADFLYTLAPIIHSQTNGWVKRLTNAIFEQKGWVVLRTLYMSSKQYIDHLRAIRGWNNKIIPKRFITALDAELSSDLWIVEISLPELFPANRRKLGEIVLNPTTKLSMKKDSTSVMFARILDKIYFISYDDHSKKNLVSYNVDIDTHTKLYTT